MKFDPSHLPEALRVHWEGETGRVRIYNRDYGYYVISSDLHPAPKFFVGCKPNYGVPAFISSQVPGKYRRFMVAHDLYEWLYLADRPQRCGRALEFELGRVPTHMLDSYLPFRITTFEEILLFASDPVHGEGFSDEQRGMFRENIDYLSRLHRKLAA